MTVGADDVDLFEINLDQKGLMTRSMRGSAVTMVTKIVIMALRFGSQIVLARLLLPADFGLLAMVAPLVEFLQIFGDVGLGQALVQRERLTQRQVSSLFWFNIALSAGIGALVMLLAPVMAIVYSEPRVMAVMACLGILIPLGALTIHPNGILLRQMKFATIAKIEVAANVVNIIVTIACAMHGLSYWSLVIGQAATSLTTAGLLWLSCRWRPSRPALEPGTWHDVKFGANITGFRLATFASTSGDNIIVGLANGRDALGLYDRSYKLVVLPLQQLMAPLDRIAIPLLSRLRSDPTAYSGAYLQLVRTMLLMTIPMLIVCVERAEPLIHLLLGPRWMTAVPIFSWICVGGFASALYASTPWLYISQDRGGQMLTFATMTAVINVTSFGIGAWWGIVGVAAVSAVSFCAIQTPLMLYGATRAGPVTRWALVACVAPSLCGGAIAAGALHWLVPHLQAEWLELLAATVMTYAVFALTVYLLPGGRAYFEKVRGVPALLRVV